jgi:hypothetical protein
MQPLCFCLVKRYSFQKRVSKFTTKKLYEIDPLYYKHCYDPKFIILEIVKSVACTINMIIIVIDDYRNITMVRDASRVMLQIVASLNIDRSSL